MTIFFLMKYDIKLCAIMNMEILETFTNLPSKKCDGTVKLALIVYTLKLCLVVLYASIQKNKTKNEP